MPDTAGVPGLGAGESEDEFLETLVGKDGDRPRGLYLHGKWGWGGGEGGGGEGEGRGGEFGSVECWFWSFFFFFLTFFFRGCWLWKNIFDGYFL